MVRACVSGLENTQESSVAHLQRRAFHGRITSPRMQLPFEQQKADEKKSRLQIKIQYNFNGSNAFGTMKLYSRQVV